MSFSSHSELRLREGGRSGAAAYAQAVARGRRLTNRVCVRFAGDLTYIEFDYGTDGNHDQRGGGPLKISEEQRCMIVASWEPVGSGGDTYRQPRTPVRVVMTRRAA